MNDLIQTILFWFIFFMLTATLGLKTGRGFWFGFAVIEYFAYLTAKLAVKMRWYYLDAYYTLQIRRCERKRELNKLKIKKCQRKIKESKLREEAARRDQTQV